MDTGGAVVRRIAVEDATVVVQAESFHNDLHAHHGRLDPGEAGATPENGLVVAGDAARGETRLRWSGDLPEGRARVWILLDGAAPATTSSRATLVVRSHGQPIGSVEGVAPETGVDAPPQTARSGWVSVGEAIVGPASELEIVFARKPESPGATVAVDALAVEPLP
jgi:hypothetical protein